MCTIASMPRLPEHCIEYARMLLWPKEKPFGGMKSHCSYSCFCRNGLCMAWGSINPADWLMRPFQVNRSPCVCGLDGVVLDGDDPEHIQWVYQRSLERAAEFNITGVTYRLTQGEHTQHICLSTPERSYFSHSSAGRWAKVHKTQQAVTVGMMIEARY